MTEDQRAATPCVIALCNCGCKRVSYANVKDREFTTAEIAELGRMVACGYEVITTTVADARSREWFCEKKRAARDTDRSGEAGQTAQQAGPKARAGAEGIAKPGPVL